MNSVEFAAKLEKITNELSEHVNAVIICVDSEDCFEDDVAVMIRTRGPRMSRIGLMHYYEQLVTTHAVEATE